LRDGGGRQRDLDAEPALRPGVEIELAVVRGGSYVTDLATDLRTWVRSEVPAESRDSTIGFRCVYDVQR